MSRRDASRDPAAVLDIVDSARLALEFVEGVDAEAFRGDLKTQSAVLHRLIVIGEAVKRLSAAYRDAHPDVPWRLIAGMRDRVIHGYDDVDVDEVWRTLHEELPELLRKLEVPG